MIKIRNVNAEDAAELLKIYEYYVFNTAITFDMELPSVDDFKAKINKISSKYPFICIEDNGKIKGYAYSHKFYGKEAYRFSNEVTIYLDIESKGKGYGRLLYNELEKRLKANGILNLYACIASPISPDKYLNNNSEQFHNHLGYKRIGLFTKCGYKFNTWYNMIWMEKIIGEHK